MKQKRDISWFSICRGLFFLPVFIPLLLSAQEANTHIIRDSVPAKSEGTLQISPSDLFPPKNNTFPLYHSDLYPENYDPSVSYSSKQPGYIPHYSLKGDIYLPYQTNPSPIFRGDYHTDGIMKQFRHGTLIGSGGQTSLPGIGRINDASLGYQHAFNSKLALQVNVNAMKINMAHSTGQAFNTSGILSYHPSDQVTFKFFGSYDIGNSYGMSTHRYGATMSVDMSERFNMEVGVQRYYNAIRGRWETVPVVIPSYRFKKFELGFDVGGLLYEILREVVFDNRGSSGPTIGPSRFSMPIK